MAIWLSKLLLLLSVVLMPLAMTPAAAAPSEHGAAHSAMPMEHCPDEGSKRDASPGIAACNMACAAALPAIVAGVAGIAPLAAIRAALDEPRELAGLDPESADPPPRIA